MLAPTPMPALAAVLRPEAEGAGDSVGVENGGVVVGIVFVLVEEELVLVNEEVVLVEEELVLIVA